MWLFQFSAPLSFGAAADVGHQVRERVKVRTAAIVLDFTGLTYIDVSAARAVETIACDARLAGKTVYVTGMNEQVQKVLAGLNADHCLPADTTFESRLGAIRAAVTATTATA